MISILETKLVTVEVIVLIMSAWDLLHNRDKSSHFTRGLLVILARLVLPALRAKTPESYSVPYSI